MLKSSYLYQLLSLLSHGDMLYLHEMAKHIDRSKYQTSALLNNHNPFFINKKVSNHGTRSRRVFGISPLGLFELKEAKAEPEVHIKDIPPAMLAFLHTKVFRPYVEIRNTGKPSLID